MDVNSHSAKAIRKPQIFNKFEKFIEGWYWLLPSHFLGIYDVKSLTLFGRDLVVYRGENSQVVVCDAYCPHLGTHLAQAMVIGNELRCPLHQWHFNSDGICVEMPCLQETVPLKLKIWPSLERYGLIWIWTGELPKQTLPFVPELEFCEFDSVLGTKFVLNYHPHLMVVKSIDLQHFQLGRKDASKFSLEKQELNPNAIIFTKSNRNHQAWSLINVFRSLYQHPIYSICCWYASTVTLTVGSDLQRFYVMLATRLLDGGKAEVQPIFFTKRRKGLHGWLYNKFLFWLSSFLIQPLANDDDKVWETMQFNMQTPTKADEAIVELINHVEFQKPLLWKTWLLARVPDTQIKENQTKWRDELTND